MNNIKHICNCYGCGVCAIVCPRKIIEIKENPNGFYEPVVIDMTHCNECGLCLSVCAFNDTKITTGKTTPDFYAAWSKDAKIRHNTSSGGIGFMLAKHLIGQGFRACGVRYNPQTKRAEHFITDTIEGFLPSMGSKYIPSYTLEGFSKLNRKDQFFITGTPCQIDSIRRWIRKVNIEHNFVLLDFFCHGVPSLNMWRKYLQTLPIQSGDDIQVKWRDKTNGWHDSWTMNIFSNKHEFTSSFLTNGDWFYRFFLGNFCLSKACYDHCKYKMEASAADIRIGDLWGNAYRDNNEGVSALLALTARGKEIIGALDECHLELHPGSVVMEGQMRKSAPKPMIYPLINQMLKSNKSLPNIFIYIKIYNFLRLPVRVFHKIKTLITQ